MTELSRIEENTPCGWEVWEGDLWFAISFLKRQIALLVVDFDT